MKFLKNRGFTDRLYFMNLLFAWLYTLLCVILSIYGGKLGIEDYSFVSVVTPLIWAEVGIHSGLVVWKAKSENMSKHGNQGNVMM